MFWIADVLIGTNSYRWGKGDDRASAVERPDKVNIPGTKSRGNGFAPVRRAWSWLTGRLYDAHQRRITEGKLHRLSDHMLRDIGISRFEIETVLNNPGQRYSREAHPRVLHRPGAARLAKLRANNNSTMEPNARQEATGSANAVNANSPARRAA